MYYLTAEIASAATCGPTKMERELYKDPQRERLFSMEEVMSDDGVMIQSYHVATTRKFKLLDVVHVVSG